ncbi:unnamed protein product [Fusarium fujikuroi]|nr:unnamed protein product [Fusarium fujikuroi]
MDPFIHTRDLPFVICKVCNFSYVANEVSKHLKTKHPTIRPVQAKAIDEAIALITGIAQNRIDLKDFKFPDPSDEPIPYLKPPTPNCKRCHICGYANPRKSDMRRHYRTEHEWRSDWIKGGNIKKKLEQPRQVPWVEGVWCQRFVEYRQGSRWFEVCKPVDSLSHPVRGSEGGEDAAAKLMRLHQEQVNKFNAAEENEIKVADEKKEPSAWLERTGWAGHLQRFKAKKDLSPLAAPLQEDEPVLQVICDTFDRLADHAKAAAVPSIVGLAALYQIERKEIHIKPSKPFDNRLEDESWTQYKGYWMTMLRIWHRMDDRQDEDRPPYKLTIRQGDLWDEFVEAAEAVVAGQARQNGLTDEKIERLCLDMLIEPSATVQNQLLYN